MLPLDARPVCADPVWLFYVDAAFKRPGGKRAEYLTKHACSCCPVRTECLLAGIMEHGIWGGLSSHARTRAGSPSPGSFNNLDYRRRHAKAAA